MPVPWSFDDRRACVLGLAAVIASCGPTAAGSVRTGGEAGGTSSTGGISSTSDTDGTGGSGTGSSGTDPCQGDPCCGDPWCCGAAGRDGPRCQPPPNCETNADCREGSYCVQGSLCSPAPSAGGCGEPSDAYTERIVLEPTFGGSVVPSVTALGPGRVAAFHPDEGGGPMTSSVRIWSISAEPPAATPEAPVAYGGTVNWATGGDFDGDGVQDLVLGVFEPVFGLVFVRGEPGGGFTPSQAVFPIDDLAVADPQVVALVDDLVPGHPGQELFFALADTTLRAVFQVTDGEIFAPWIADDAVPLGASAAIGPLDGLMGMVHLVYPVADQDAFASHAAGAGGVFDPLSSLVPDAFDGEGRRAVASVGLGGGDATVARAWTVHGVPALTFFDGPDEPVLIGTDPIPGDLRLVGLDAGGGEPARIAAFAPDGLPLTLVVPDLVPSPRVGCIERTFPDLGSVVAAAAVDANGDGVAGDLLVVRGTDGQHELVVLLR